MKSLLIGLAVLAVTASPAFAQFDMCDRMPNATVSANLFGSQFDQSAFSPTAFGNATITFDRFNQARLQFRGTDLDQINNIALYRNGTLVTHFGGDNDMLEDDFPDIDFREGFIDARVPLDPATINDIRVNPGLYTIRVDTTTFPAGAIRGSLVGNRFFGVTLTPDNIAGTVGDPNALGSIAFTIRNDAAAGTGNVFLDFEFIGTDLGNQLETLEIRRAMNGELVATLATDQMLTDGRTTGTIVLPQETLNEFLVDPAAFQVFASTPQFPTGAVSGQVAMTNEIFIPVIGSIQGDLGSRWSSDLRLFNTSTTTAVVLAQFFPRGANPGNAPSRSTTFILEPNSSIVIDDTLNGLFEGQEGIGALRLTSNADIAATGRIFNDQRSAGLGTFGQVMPALTRCDAMNRGIITGFIDENEAAARFTARSNIGMFNPWNTATAVQFSLWSGEGALLATRTIALEPWMQMQTSLLGNGGLFPGIDMDIVSGTVTFQSTLPIFTYGSVIDNDSGDPSTLLPQIWNAVVPASAM